MPSRPPLTGIRRRDSGDSGDNTDTTFGPAIVEGIEDVRLGTRDQYESEWVKIEGNSVVATHVFTHELDEIPWVVDVLRSGTDDGGNASVATQHPTNNILTGVTLTGSATLNPSSLATAAGETLQITVTGAALGDFVVVSAPYDLVDMVVTAYIQAADTVDVRIENVNATNPTNLASGTWRAAVTPFGALTHVSDVTVTKNETTISVKNNTGSDLYFKVRAM